MANSYDLVVIGAGPGGYVAAIRAAQLGLSTLCVDREFIGGVCLNVGCIPSKALIHAGEIYHSAQHAEAMGISFGKPKLDIKKMVAWKQGVVDGLTGGVAMLFKKNGVDFVKGDAKFASSSSLLVQTPDGEKQFGFETAIVATGSRPASVPGLDFGGPIMSSTEALALDKVPKKLVVVGGGYIGLELGQVLSKLGSDVTVVEFLDSVLPNMEKDIRRVMARHLKKQGITVHTSCAAKSFKAGEVLVQPRDEEKEPFSIEADKVLVAVGRSPNSGGLGLEEIGVKIDKRGFVEVDHQCRSSVSNIFAIGDLAGEPMLAHKASKQGIITAEVVAGKPSAADFRAIPAVVFTDPEIATVGQTAAEAEAAGHEVKVEKFPLSALGRSLATGFKDGFVKIVADASTDIILGIQAIGPRVTDIISEGALAIEMAATAFDVAATIHPHPTFGEAIMEAAEGIHGTHIHIWK